ncbi:MAG: AAA family ATPase [Fimbriimonadaceae bacterium]|nr:AAA family ATPase [Fimbriimonadaceae bacterium]
MNQVKFEVRNFKGLRRLNLDVPENTKTLTLIGLNETGKTTVLEALNFLSYTVEKTTDLSALSVGQFEVFKLIPISERHDFNDQISVSVTFNLDRGDVQALVAKAKELGYSSLAVDNLFKVTEMYRFKNSELIGSRMNSWDITFKALKGRSTKEKLIDGSDWQTLVQVLKSRMPKVFFFENFLFEFPDAIYLDESADNSGKGKFYRSIIEHVLLEVAPGSSIQTHLIDRIKSDQIAARQALDSLLLKMSQYVSKMVLGEWNKIFGRPQTSREIKFDFGCDEDGDCYIEIKIREGGDIYEVNDRSLGFRWFLSFLLATTYATKGFSSPALLLLDEPASNLHPAAQARLLNSLDSMTNCRIIYTTHSHHMVNADWLGGTYVVRNLALLHTSEGDDYDPKSTEIEVFKYRTFVSNYPDQVSYFQPVLDVLEYQPNRLSFDKSVVVVEGKSDFHAFRLGLRGMGEELAFSVIPGTGAGSSRTLIQLLSGWGIPFIVLLDSDEEGKKQMNNYTDRFGEWVKIHMMTLTDCNSEWEGKGLEEAIGKDEMRRLISSVLGDDAKVDKKRFNRAMEIELMDSSGRSKKLEEFATIIRKALMVRFKNILEK